MQRISFATVAEAGCGKTERRVAVRAKKTTIFLLLFFSLFCLLSAAASLTGYLPYAVGPLAVMICASVVGLLLAHFESRNP